MAAKKTTAKKAPAKTKAKAAKQTRQVQTMNLGAIKSTGTRAAKARNAKNTVNIALRKYKDSLADHDSKVADQEYNLKVLQETLTLAKEKHDPDLEGMIQELERSIKDSTREYNKTTISRDALRNVLSKK